MPQIPSGPWFSGRDSFFSHLSAWLSLTRLRVFLDRLFPSRTVLLGIWAGMLFSVTGLAFSTLNTTPSLPKGLYAHGPVSQPLQNGSLVLVCLSPGPARFGLARGYIPKSIGSERTPCPETARPLLKRVLAVPGDTVRVDFSGVLVNGKRTLPPPPHCDGQSRPIPIQYGTHYLEEDQYWLSTDQYLSYDSRIYGPVHWTQILSQARPLITTDPDLSRPPPMFFRRSDCSNLPSPSQPLLSQTDPFSSKASLDSLTTAADAHPFSTVRSLSPSRDFMAHVTPSDVSFDAPVVDSTTRLPPDAD